MDQPNPNLHQDPNDLSFNVMPQDGKSSYSSGPAPSPNRTPGTPPPAPSASSAGTSVEYPASTTHHKMLYIIIGIVVLLLLGGAAYYFLGMNKTTDSQQQTTTKLPKVWLTQYFSTESCTDINTCGDEADPENDGLKNYDEFKAGTNPLNPDTDKDGLADGDEINIYKTEPTLKYTDRREVVAQNDWTDGYQIKNGFDPLTPAIKFTDIRKKQIEEAIKQFKLHEPSISTTTTSTTSPSPSPSTTNWKTYSNKNHKFEVKYPSDWNVKEYAAPSESVYFVSAKAQANTLGEISINFTKMTPCPTSTNVTMQVSNVTVYKNSSDESKLTAACILDGSTARIEFGLSDASSRIPHAVPVLSQMLSTFKFTK